MSVSDSASVGSGDPSSSSTTSRGGDLNRSLTLPDLILYGVGSSVGAGVYSLIGIGASSAGPSVVLSFFLCGVACLFTSLCYAEFAARFPDSSGSAYTFVAATFGEFWGWTVGWNLTLEYGVSAAVVARSWAAYARSLVGAVLGSGARDAAASSSSSYEWSPLAAAVVGACVAVQTCGGVRESARFNAVMTCVNLTVLSAVVVCGLSVTSPVAYRDNLAADFFPRGLSGTAAAAGTLFFSYLGFDMVACLSGEVRDPTTTMPRVVLGSLAVSALVYCTVSFAVVSMVPAAFLSGGASVSNALLANACCAHDEQTAAAAAGDLAACVDPSRCGADGVRRPALLYADYAVSLGALAGLTTATFTCLMGQPRIFYRMARDGLLPEVFAKLHPVTKVPVTSTVVCGIVVSVAALAVPLEPLANMISLGALSVFTFVNASVIVLRGRPASSSSCEQTAAASRTRRTEEDEEENSATVANGEHATDVQEYDVDPYYYGPDVLGKPASSFVDGLRPSGLQEPLLLGTIKEEESEPPTSPVAAYLRMHNNRGRGTAEMEEDSIASTSVGGDDDADGTTTTATSATTTTTTTASHDDKYKDKDNVSAYTFTSLAAALDHHRRVGGDHRSATASSSSAASFDAALADNGSKPASLSAVFALSVTVVSAVLTRTDDDDGNVPSSLRVARLSLVALGAVAAAVSAAALVALPLRSSPVTINDQSLFQCPWVPTVPLLGIACNAALMGSLPWTAWASVGAWTAAGLAAYFGYQRTRRRPRRRQSGRRRRLCGRERGARTRSRTETEDE